MSVNRENEWREEFGFILHGLAVNAVWVLIVVLVCVALARAAEPAPKVELLPTEADAVGWAFTALLAYPESEQPYVRFVWLPPYADPAWIGVTNFAVNAACNHTTTLIKADVKAGGWLLAYNLRLLAPDPMQLAGLVLEWDSLAERDSRFHVPAVNLVGAGAVLAPHLQAALARHATEPEKSERVDVLLTQLGQSTGGIYPADFLIEQLLTSAVGKYPEFRQIDFQVKDGVKPISAHLAKRGFFPGESKDRFAEKGAMLISSDVTGKQRVVLTSYGVASRQPLAVTFDFEDSRTRPDEQFIRNLIDFEKLADAQELLIPLPCGLWEGVLADGRGNVQRVAPPDVVADSTKPDGHTKELEMGMSCVMCHAAENGYKTARNDLSLLINSDADYFGDEVQVGSKVLSRAEAVAFVAGRFGEPVDLPDGVLGRARRDYQRAVDILTEHKPTADGPTSVQALGVKLKEIYHGYRYRKIDAERACLALGVRVPPDVLNPARAQATLRQLVPAPPSGQPEDVVIALLKNGAQITRNDFDAVYGEMARRAVETRSSLVVTE